MGRSWWHWFRCAGGGTKIQRNRTNRSKSDDASLRDRSDFNSKTNPQGFSHLSITDEEISTAITTSLQNGFGTLPPSGLVINSAYANRQAPHEQAALPDFRTRQNNMRDLVQNSEGNHVEDRRREHDASGPLFDFPAENQVAELEGQQNVPSIRPRQNSDGDPRVDSRREDSFVGRSAMRNSNTNPMLDRGRGQNMSRVTFRNSIDAEVIERGREQDMHREPARRHVSLDSLREMYAKFEKANSLQTKHPGIYHYVRVLETDNKNYTSKLRELDASLDSIQARLIAENRELPAWRAKELREKGLGDKGLLNFLFVQYENKIGQFAIEISRLRNLEKEHLADIGVKGKRIDTILEQLDQVVKSHENEKRRLKDLYDTKITEFRAAHTVEINGLRNLSEQQEMKHNNYLKEVEQSYSDILTQSEDAHQREKAGLEAKIARLQVDIVSAVDPFQPLADGDVRKRYDVLRDRVHALAWNQLEVAPEALGEAFNEIQFIQTAPRNHRKFVLESFYWRILTDGLFVSPFQVFGDHGQRFTDAWYELFGSRRESNSSALDWPVPDTLVEKWRYDTFETLRNSLMGPRPLKKIKLSYEANTAKIKNAFSEAFSQVSSQDKEVEIHSIVQEAASLALDLGIQRCRLHLFAPRPSEMISISNNNVYEDLNDDNNSFVSQGTVQLVIRPGLRKTGDGRGGNLNSVTNLRSAAVYLKTSSN